jgi:hypothetical protein
MAILGGLGNKFTAFDFGNRRCNKLMEGLRPETGLLGLGRGPRLKASGDDIGFGFLRRPGRRGISWL